jgi:hypothetical protein
MQSTDSELSSDDSGSGDDPRDPVTGRQSGSVLNSLSQLQDDYATGSDSVVSCTPENKFEEQDGLCDCSDLHTPAQPSKPRRLPSTSPVKGRQVPVSELDSDGVDHYSLFESTPTRKRGFFRPRLPWSLVQEWDLGKNDRGAVYEEIRNIMGLSLDEAGSKSFIKPNANAIFGWRSKQVSCFFPASIFSVLLTVYFVLQNYVSRKETSRSTRNTFICP